MPEIKLILKPSGDPQKSTGGAGGAACCCAPLQAEWTTGTVNTPAGPVCRVSTTLTRSDIWGGFKCRVSFFSFRDSYSVPPGLYAVGEPGEDSNIFVSANYKFSFDTLRRRLSGLDAWVLVLDTKGINVWCAAGKGTFGTAELIERIRATGLDRAAGRGRLILPQLGAPGVNASEVRKKTGFRVCYGPVRAADIPEYIKADYRATGQMREVRFGLLDRLVLSPMEIIPAMKRYPLFALAVLAVFGLGPKGIIFRDAFSGGLPFLLLGLVSVFAGAFLVPVLLPFIPFKSFAVKGWIAGAAAVLISMKAGLPGRMDPALIWAACIFFPMASSYIALQFTGSTTFTCISGVKKELKAALPVYILSAAVAVALLLVYKLLQWRVI